MPPPSPPQHYPSRGQSGNPSFLSTPFLSREPPHTAAHHRPGSSMSISSMLGSDADRPPRDVGSSIFSRLPVSSGPFGSAPPPPSAPGAMSPPSAPARQSPLDYPLFRRSQTPEKPVSRNNQAGRPYRSSSGGGPPTTGAEQPKYSGLSRLSSASQYSTKTSSAHPSPQVSPAEPSYNSNESRRMSVSGPPRPNSQPQHLEPPIRPAGYSPLSRPAATPGESSFGGLHQRPSYMGGDSQHGRFGGLYGERQSEEQARRDRERGMSHQPETKASAPPSRYSSLYGEREPAAGRQQGSSSSWDLGRSQPTSPESKRFPAPEPNTSTFGFGAIQNYTKSLGSQPGGTRQNQLSVQTQQGHRTSSPRDQPSYLKRHSESRPYPGQPSGPSPSSYMQAVSDDQPRKGSDELLHHRNLLGVGLDAKRGGRASPLPQAVQGAQAQILGPAGESGIKSELGRVFAGIGSGVDGVTATSTGSGPSTPMTASPFKRDSVTARSINTETTTEESKLARPASATDKRLRRSEEENRLETDNGLDGRLGGSTRGGRRSRAAHHHHHHHCHHHHLHKPEEEPSPFGSSHRPLSMNAFQRPSDALAAEPAHPHHHHHHHHHHHIPRTAATALTPMREPRTVVTIEPVLSSVAQLPRHHLGSTLYAPQIGAPTAKATLESAKFGYTTTPLPLPRFDGKENCTFTIRVPRFRIDNSHREEICARRALWGTGIYTDDSDPVAAAIHSGFIRGAWGEDVDVDMLDLEIQEAFQHAPKTAKEMGLDEEERPKIPPTPPSDKDLHITLLILPKLERYESSVLFGLKSRSWEQNHDGMSFKVLRTEWVDEGVGRAEERSGEARRKRLRNMIQSGRICTGPGVVKLDQLRSGILQIPRRKTKMIESQEQQPASAMQTVS
ncbi:histone deacetylation protein Rxt3-domain-containing protein [Aspergillus crustosus]